MADGNQKAAWGHTVAVAAGFNGGSKAILPMIPDRYKQTGPVVPKTAAAEKQESDLGFAILKEGLRSKAKEWRA